MFKRIAPVLFPSFSGINVNMMPIIFGDHGTIPADMYAYIPLIERCEKLVPGRVAYLTIHESFVEEGKTQRRPGIHTDGVPKRNWGGGWGKSEHGIYMASSDGACRAWNATTLDVDDQGGLLSPPQGECVQMDPSILYWMSDRTPHQSLPALAAGNRQFFRLVSHDVDIWWRAHSTPNPLGIQPDCLIIEGNKFQRAPSEHQ